jgi:multiple sugar transport system ATP-binding protein
MNVVNGTLRRNGNGTYVEAEGGVRWPLAVSPGVDAQPVVYGIRPEHLRLAGSDAPYKPR